MAAALTARLRAGVPSLAGAAVAIAGLAALLAGCATPGELRDNGVTARVTPPTVPQPLWSDLAAAPPPTSSGRATEPPPQPVPDVTAPGQDITALDLRTLLAKDPGVTADERRALDGCPGCELRSPEFRDLTGDGRPELVTAVGTATGVVLHVYTLTGDHVLPVLRVQVLKGFSAKTVGSDLWLDEPTSVSAQTRSHYGWDGVRLSLLEQKLEGIGSIPVPAQGSTDPAVTPSSGPGAPPDAARPSVRPTAVPAPPGRTAVPGNGTGGAGTTPRTATPVPAPPARPTSAPEAKP
ncbi:hypothetical protein [Streptomyces sp. CB01881]|uniref:hypothetical protein n=1 Tax=Streptomyces sp. CB01881 TaxID=2078691 RepID=UPI0011DF3889|nr:hypothetical protein [Streptomyces sp. CB01881]TYC76656.1 hypothetical protein EH183_03445 [Streptomyces sp. CB01881]